MKNKNLLFHLFETICIIPHPSSDGFWSQVVIHNNRFNRIIKMKMFQRVRKSLQNLGIHPTQTSQEIPFNSKNIIILIILFIFCILLIVSLLLKFKTMKEYTENFYVFFTLIIVVLVMFEFIRTILKLIEKIEYEIEKR